ncbi:LuxR C-terminal-related transcriptional regulator [Variovorax sp. J2P1-59]|uniref:response regulator transcription factor n=1 Tax=Variovorax flavidus TaxID=3053501 RepID=UPI002577FA64|nr:response regulator [Variovorax sp. J2P1-59]MDM0078269.1 LuxR C-terminal-related transcriptional regulator [Variovorax sp. J2P1-59]
MTFSKNGASGREDAETSVIRVVDDDGAFRRAVCDQLMTAGHTVRDYGSIGELLRQGIGDEPGCLILDLHMPGPDWLDLQDVVTRSAEPLPVIVLTAKASAHDTLRAMKAGAADFFLKPVDRETLVGAVTNALANHLSRRRTLQQIAALKARYATLTPRERQVAAMVVAGAFNKEIGVALGTAERTVKLHRANAMEKMGARSLPDLVRAFSELDAAPSGPAAFG